MNILAKAISQVGSLYPSKMITIRNETSELFNGIDIKKSVEIVTVANIQQLKPSEVKAFDTYTDSFECLRFYILGSDIKIVASALENNFTSASIIYNNKTYKVYYREDWSLNGWVIIEAVCQGVASD